MRVLLWKKLQAHKIKFNVIKAIRILIAFFLPAWAGLVRVVCKALDLKIDTPSR